MRSRPLGAGARAAVAAGLAMALCVLLAGMVGRATSFFLAARSLQHPSAPAAPWSVDGPMPTTAVRALPSVPASLESVLLSKPSVARRLSASRAKAMAAVMSNAFPYRRAVLHAAARHAVDPGLVLAIIASESGGDPAAVSPSGAIGLMQLMPGTAFDLGVDPWDPEENIEGAVRYLSLLLRQFGSVDLSLVAYNAGPLFAQRYRQGEVDLGAETREFLMRVAGLQ